MCLWKLWDAGGARKNDFRPCIACFVGCGLVHGAVHFIKQNNGADLKLQGPPKIMFFTCLGIEFVYCSSTVARSKHGGM